VDGTCAAKLDGHINSISTLIDYPVLWDVGRGVCELILLT
jgi:hypothetical protein